MISVNKRVFGREIWLADFDKCKIFPTVQSVQSRWDPIPADERK